MAVLRCSIVISVFLLIAPLVESKDKFKYVDLTHILDENTVHFSNPPFQISNLKNLTVPEYPGFLRTEIITTALHMGTHFDAPCFFGGSQCLHEVPFDHLILPAAVIDISDQVGDDPTVHLNISDIQDWESKHGPIPSGSLLLVNTGWSRHYLDPQKYSGSTPEGAFSYPSMTVEAGKWLSVNRAIFGIGIDSPCLDAFDANFGAHYYMFGKNIYGLENVKDLHLLPPTGAVVYVMPMKIRDASGAPAMVVARLPKEDD